MGTWGTAIYSNDTAEDVRDACKDIFAFYDVEEGNKVLFEEFKEIINQGWVDNDYASFWYALADWQWKHGMLTPTVQNKALELLESYAGIDEWIEAGEKGNVEKRRKVLEKLKEQLLMPQNPLKKPRLSIAKPKHKPGDIIVFQAAESEKLYWKKKAFSVPLVFRSKKISGSKYEDINGYDGRGKYMAILCIGKAEWRHSRYIPDIYDEYSMYAWYDYMSEKEPTVEELGQSGFLPMVNKQWKDFNRRITDYVEWTYSFTIELEKFKESDDISKIVKLYSLSEVERFKRLFSQKNYSSYALGYFDLPHTFSAAFTEKNRMELLGENIDNLLDSNVTNPEFLSPSEIDKAHEAFREELRKKAEVYYSKLSCE